MNLPVHPSEILHENEEIKKLDPEWFRVKIQTDFINTSENGSMNLRINDSEQSVFLVLKNPFATIIDHQDTVLFKIPLQEFFEMLKRGISTGKISRKSIIARLKLRKLNPNALNE